MCLLDALLDCGKQEEKELGVIAEAKLNAINIQFSSFLSRLYINAIF